MKEGRSPQEILEQKRKYFGSVINGHLACPERMWEEGGKRQQVCLEGRVCLQMYFKLLKWDALVLLHSGEEGFEVFISLPQTPMRWVGHSLSPFKGLSGLFKLDCHQVTRGIYLRTSYSPRGRGPACSKSSKKHLHSQRRRLRVREAPACSGHPGSNGILSAMQGYLQDFVSSTVYRWLNRQPRTTFLKWGFLFYVFLN